MPSHPADGVLGLRRSPLSAPILTWSFNGARWKDARWAPQTRLGEPYPCDGHCGEYNGQISLAVLDDVLTRLRDAGMFVMLDMHVIDFPEGK